MMSVRFGLTIARPVVVLSLRTLRVVGARSLVTAAILIKSYLAKRLLAKSFLFGRKLLSCAYQRSLTPLNVLFAPSLFPLPLHGNTIQRLTWNAIDQTTSMISSDISAVAGFDWFNQATLRHQQLQDLEDRLATWLMNWTPLRPGLRSSFNPRYNDRDTFVRSLLGLSSCVEQCPITLTRTVGNPIGVSNRSTFVNWVEALARDYGWVPWYLNCPSEKPHEKGMVVWRVGTDTHAPQKSDRIAANGVMVLIDDDGFADLNHLLSFARPIFIFGFQPVGVSAEHYAWYVGSDNRVVYEPRSGGSWAHEVWEHQRDKEVTVRNQFGGYTTYKVVTSRLDADVNKAVTVYVPLRSFWGPQVTTNPVKRMQYVHSDIVLYRLVASTTSYVVVGLPGFTGFFTFPADMLKGTHIHIANDVKHARSFLINTAHRLLKRLDLEDSGLTDQVATRLFHTSVKLDELSIVRVRGSDLPTDIITTRTDTNSVKPTQTATPTSATYFAPNTPGKPVGYGHVEACSANLKGLALPSPTTETNSVPIIDEHTERIAVTERITKCLNTVPFDKTAFALSVKFKEAFKVTEYLQPHEFPEVAQARSTIRSRQRCLDAGGKTVDPTEKLPVKIMLKRETAAPGAPCRVICNVDPAHNTFLSSFVNPVVEQLKTLDLPCFVCGYGPEELALRIQPFDEYQSANSPLIRERFVTCETDFSKFDATASRALCTNVSNSFLLAFFKPGSPEHSDLKALLAAEMDVVLVSEHTKLKVDCMNLSGSAFTTWRNTIHNAFLAYYGLVAIGETHDMAFEVATQFNRYLGDDGLSYVPKDKITEYVSAVNSLGVTLKLLETRTPIFLGRYWFLDARTPTGHTPSMCDVTRALYNLGAVSNLSHTWEEAWFLKCSGRLVTDDLTPLVGPWCSTAILLCHHFGLTAVRTQDTEQASWVQANFSTENWHTPPRELANKVVLQATGLTAIDLSEFEARLGLVRKLADLGKYKTLLEAVDDLPMLQLPRREPKVPGLWVMEGDKYVPIPSTEGQASQRDSPGPEVIPADTSKICSRKSKTQPTHSTPCAKPNSSQSQGAIGSNAPSIHSTTTNCQVSKGTRTQQPSRQSSTRSTSRPRSPPPLQPQQTVCHGTQTSQSCQLITAPSPAPVTTTHALAKPGILPDSSSRTLPPTTRKQCPSSDVSQPGQPGVASLPSSLGKPKPSSTQTSITSGLKTTSQLPSPPAIESSLAGLKSSTPPQPCTNKATSRCTRPTDVVTVPASLAGPAITQAHIRTERHHQTPPTSSSQGVRLKCSSPHRSTSRKRNKQPAPAPGKLPTERTSQSASGPRTATQPSANTIG